jgi:hypothetical protein
VQAVKSIPKIDDLLTGVTSELNGLASINGKRRVPKLTNENLPEVVSLLKISLTDRYDEPPVCIQIGCARFATLGNFSAVIGKAKSRKTFFISLLLSECVKHASSGIRLIKTSLPSGKGRSVYIDTEQSKADVLRVAQRVAFLSHNFDTDHFDCYGLRSLTPAERLKVIEHIIETTADLGILIIDGIRDLISDINNADEATAITSKLLKWTEERNIHISVVLHQNKNDSNARGHLGTEIINKAESVISVEKDNDTSIVKPEFCRGKDFDPFAFIITEDGLPLIISDWSDRPQPAVKKPITPYDIPKETHQEIVKSVFIANRSPKYNELLSLIKNEFDRSGVKFGDNKARDFISYYLTEKLITKGEEKPTPFYRPLLC